MKWICKTATGLIVLVTAPTLAEAHTWAWDRYGWISSIRRAPAR